MSLSNYSPKHNSNIYMCVRLHLISISLHAQIFIAAFSFSSFSRISYKAQSKLFKPLFFGRRSQNRLCLHTKIAFISAFLFLCSLHDNDKSYLGFVGYTLGWIVYSAKMQRDMHDNSLASRWSTGVMWHFRSTGRVNLH